MCLASSAVRKIITKTALRILLAPVSMTVKKKTMTTNAGKDVEKGEPFLIHCWWEFKPVTTLQKSASRPIKKQSRKRTFIRLSYATPDHIPKDSKSTRYRDACLSIVIAALFIITRKRSQPIRSSRYEHQLSVTPSLGSAPLVLSRVKAGCLQALFFKTKIHGPTERILT